MKVAVCDDNPVFLNELTEGLRRLQTEDGEITGFQNGEALIRTYESGNAGFDVIFLDIEMDGMDGIETANQIRRMDKEVLIVFVTSHTKHMQRSFECQPFRFLIKPVQAEALQTVCREIRIRLSDRPGAFVFYENRIRTRVPCDDILFFESRGHWIILHKRDGSIHKILKSIKALWASVDQSRFCRIHRAFVVNMNFVYQVGNTELTLHGFEKPLPLSRTYKKEFTNRLLHFEERKYVL